MIKALEDDFDIALYNYSVDVIESIETMYKNKSAHPLFEGETLQFDIDQGKILPFPLGNALILVRNGAGKVISRFGEVRDFTPPFKKDFEKILQGQDDSFRTVSYSTDEADSYRVITFPFDKSKGLFLQVAAPLTLLESQINKRFDILKFGIPLVLIIAILGGFYVTGRALTPLTKMINTAQDIGANNLTGRVPVPLAKDEIQTLALTLNNMLSRIEQAFQSQEKFVADASHQLRTPLTILKGELEMIEKKIKDDDNKKLITSSLQEVEKLSGIVHDMLLLARIDAGLGALQLQNLYLDEILLEAISRIEILAKKKSVRIAFNILENQDRPAVLGDWDLLVQLFINLLDNSIKYSPEASQISVQLVWEKNHTRVIIQDEGPGIPASFQEHLFERFSRSNLSAQTEGFGLGLSIANKISQLHSAKLYPATQRSKGAEFHFEIKNI